MYVCRLELTSSAFLSSLFFETRSHTERLHLGSVRLAAGWPALGACLSPLPQCWDDRHPFLCLALLVGAGDLNSGPWTYSASALLTDFIPSPLVLGSEEGTMMSHKLVHLWGAAILIIAFPRSPQARILSHFPMILFILCPLPKASQAGCQSMES